MHDTIYMGSSVKALGNGKVAGYLVTFSDQTQPDLSAEKDFFTAATDFDLDTGNRKSVFYAHGLDVKMGVKRIGIGEVKQDEVGVWIEAQLNMRDDYEKAVYKMAEENKLGWSSGAPSHLVTRKAIKTDGGTVHEIKTWPLAEASLTPCPADHRNQAVAFKALPAMLQLPAADRTTKALPAGMSYDDLRTLLQDELNEDIGDDDDGPWGGGLWIVDIFDTALVYRDSDDGDLIRIPYTVAPGNDVTWGTPESVVRVTTYATATDGDDSGTEAAIAITGATKEADTDSALASSALTFADHLDAVLAAVGGVIERAEDIQSYRIKSGRVISAANRSKLADLHGKMRETHGQMGAHMAALSDLLAKTDPDAKKDVDEMAALRMRHERIKAGHVGVAV